MACIAMVLSYNAATLRRSMPSHRIRCLEEIAGGRSARLEKATAHGGIDCNNHRDSQRMHGQIGNGRIE
jgi:hypothetical protein